MPSAAGAVLKRSKRGNCATRLFQGKWLNARSRGGAGFVLDDDKTGAALTEERFGGKFNTLFCKILCV